MNPVTQAIALVGLQELARRLGVSHQAVRKFERTRVPDKRVADLVLATNGELTPHQVRPDLYAPGDRGAVPASLHQRQGAA